MPHKQYSPTEKAKAVLLFKSEITSPAHLLTNNPVLSALNSVCESLGGGIKNGTLASWIVTSEFDSRSELAYEIKKLKSLDDKHKTKTQDFPKSSTKPRTYDTNNL